MKVGEVWKWKNKDKHLEVINELGQQTGFFILNPEITILKFVDMDSVLVEGSLIEGKNTFAWIKIYPRQSIIDYYERYK